ncbi:lysophospholipid acyltransferase family protein [Roseibium sp. Sym1]|uniref:lysophospholipid acyltransferase family protein n=1 Tax=Roseibium sp. Sym1 TaxID=3016006 RepID=UPI0022B587B9|nr:hypothetical protein [Roseibium sp. Sym1]
MTKRLRLEDIAFDETLSPEPAAPPVRDLVAGIPEQRRAARIHWLRHTKDGLFNTVFHQVLRHFPCGFVSGFGPVLVPFLRWSYRDKIFPKRISRNLSALTPDRWPNKDVEAKALDRFWKNVARTIAEFCIVNKLWRTSRIEVEGLEHLDSVRNSGRPVIFTSMHLATWEALFVAIHDGLAGPSIGPFQPEPNRFKNRIIHAIRRERNQFLFPPGQRSAYRLHRLMASGRYSMTIFIDEVRDKQVHLPCFGRLAPNKGNAIAAIKIANACGGTLLPTYLVRTGPARFRMIILPPIERQDEAGYDVPGTVSALNDVFEPIVLENIEQWYMLSELRLPQSFEKSKYAKALSRDNQAAASR